MRRSSILRTLRQPTRSPALGLWLLCVFVCAAFINLNVVYSPPVVVLPWDTLPTLPSHSNPLDNDTPLSVDTVILPNGSCPHAASIAIWVGVRNVTARTKYTGQCWAVGHSDTATLYSQTLQLYQIHKPNPDSGTEYHWRHNDATPSAMAIVYSLST